MRGYLDIALAVAAGILIGLAGYFGHHEGVLAQQAKDQVEFDRINHELEQQKATAQKIIEAALEANANLIAARDQLNEKLEMEHAQRMAATNALRDRYAGVGLRFKPTQGAGRGDGGAGAVPAGAPAAVPAAPADVELPAAITASLRQLAYDADQLRDAYAQCYDYTHQVK